MAYGQQGTAAATRPAYTQRPVAAGKSGAANTTSTKREALFSTGLFTPTREGVKAIGSVQVKEDVVVPAGSYINLYAGDQKNEKSPAFRIQITAGQLKSAATK